MLERKTPTEEWMLLSCTVRAAYNRELRLLPEACLSVEQHDYNVSSSCIERQISRNHNVIR